MATPSPSEIFATRAKAGGWTKEMLADWGVSWPPPEGFVDDLKERWRKANMPKAHGLDIVAYASRHIQWARQKNGDYWALCPFCDDGNNPAFHVQRRSPKTGRGWFHCFKCKTGGDIVDLCMALERIGVTRALERLLDAEEAVPVFVARAPDPRVDERKRAAAAAIWDASIPLVGSLAEDYLRSRGIGCDLAHADLRFHPQAPEGYKLKRGDFVAMVGAIRTPAGELLGVHLTYLTDEATKRPGVEDFPDRRMIGNVSGGFVRLGELDSRICAGEGIESSLSASEISGRPAIAALNKGNMAALPFIPDVTDWLLAYDTDAIDEARDLARKLLPLGVTIRGLAPPRGCADWNDAAQARRA